MIRKYFFYAAGLLAGVMAELPNASAEDRASDWATEILQRIESHPILLAGRERVYSAGQDAVAAGQPLYNPTVSLQWHKKEKYDLEENYEGSIQQKVDWSGKREAREKVAQLNDIAMQSSLSDQRIQLLANAMNAVVNAHSAEKLFQTANEQQELLQRFADLLERRQHLGEASGIEVDFGYLAMARELEAFTVLEQRRTQTRLALQNALPGGMQRLKPPTELLQPIDQAVEDDRIVEQLPAVVAAKKVFESAQVGIEAARRNGNPDPTLGIYGGKDDEDKIFGLSISMPINLRNAYKAEVLSASYQATAVEQEYINTRRLALNQLQVAREAYSQLFQRWLSWQKLTDKRLADSFDLLQRLWQSGEITTSEYITQLQQRKLAQLSGYELEEDLWHGWINWLMASGQMEPWLKSLSQ